MLFVVLLLGMLVLSYPLLFKPLNAQRDAAIEETSKKQQKLSDLNTAMTHARDIKAEIDKLRTGIKFLEEKLPKETEVPTVLQDVSKAAKDNNLNIKSVRLAKAIEGADYNQQPIRMVVEGMFSPSFSRFLGQVEQMDRLTKINDMKIEADANNNGAITADFTLTIFYESSQKVAVAP
jgi:type IV pilus assembly protein PilO